MVGCPINAVLLRSTLFASQIVSNVVFNELAAAANGFFCVDTKRKEVVAHDEKFTNRTSWMTEKTLAML